MELQELALAVEHGKRKDVRTLVAQALEEGHDVRAILHEGLIASMDVIGERFGRNEVFVPEMLVAARAMSAGLELLEPLLKDNGVKPLGTIVIGTVKGDLHDIGKNLCAMMLRSIGATVYDLGVDVSAESFVEKAVTYHADIVCMSALLTTTMVSIRDVIGAFRQAGIRDQYYIMIGGAPVTQAFADEAGADAYTASADECARVARAYLEKKYPQER